MPEDKTPQEISLTPSDIKAADFSGLQSLYCNSANVLITNFDFRMLFGEIVPDGVRGLKTEPRASIVMSPQHMKALVKVLVTHLEGYEKTHGKIAWPEPEQAEK